MFVQPNRLVSNLQIDRVLLIETGRNYVDMYNKCYTVDASNHTVNKLQTILTNQSQFGKRVTENLISSTLPEMISISQPLHMARIDCDWNRTRATFIIELSYSINGLLHKMVIQGYSNYLDVSHGGHIDPNIIFYINKIQEYRQILQNGIPVYQPYNSYNVVYDYLAQDYSIYDNNRATTIRPIDVYNKIHTNTMLETDIADMSSVAVYDLSNDISSQPKPSNTSNNNPVTYISKILNTYTNNKQSGVGITSDVNDIYNSIVSGYDVKEYTITDNPFIRAMVNFTNTVSASFRLDMLKLIDPTVENRINLVLKNNQAVRQDFSSTTNIESFFKPNIENEIVTLIESMMTSILLEHNIDLLGVSFSNHTIPFTVVITNLQTIIPLDDNTIINTSEIIKHKINNIILPLITKGNNIAVDVHVLACASQDTNIMLRVNNNPEVVYRFPTFANNRYIPVVGSNTMLQTVANNVSTILDSCL